MRGRGARRIVSPMLSWSHLVAAVALTMPLGASTAVASGDPAAPPDGTVELTDDRRVLSVTVPAAWNDISTAPFGPRSSLLAATDQEAFESSFDASGVTIFEVPATNDTRALIDQYGLASGCTELSVEPWGQAGVWDGWRQDGRGCGSSSGRAQWTAIAVTDQRAGTPFTVVVQAQVSDSADAAAVAGMRLAIDTFDRVGASSPRQPALTTLVDDLGLITMDVPATWSEIDTRKNNIDRHTFPLLVASTDLEAYLDGEDVSGVTFAEVPHTTDFQSVLDRWGVNDGYCENVEVGNYLVPGVWSGVQQYGTGCGANHEGVWQMIAANDLRAGVPFTALVQWLVVDHTAVEYQAAADSLGTFDRLGVTPTRAAAAANGLRAGGDGRSTPGG